MIERAHLKAGRVFYYPKSDGIWQYVYKEKVKNRKQFRFFCEKVLKSGYRENCKVLVYERQLADMFLTFDEAVLSHIAYLRERLEYFEFIYIDNAIV